MTIRLLLPVTLDLHPHKAASLERVSPGLVADVYEAECRCIWPTGSRSDGVHVWEEVESHELAGLLPTSQPRAEVRDHSNYIKASDTKTPPEWAKKIMEANPKLLAIEKKRIGEGGAGISSLPEKRESLAFLDEDLLCEDAE